MQMEGAMHDIPDYFTRYENFVLSRSATGVLTVRFHTDGAEHIFTGTTHRDFPRLVEDIAYDRDNKVLVLIGTGSTFIDSIDGPSPGDLTKPWNADLTYLEGRRGVQRLVDLEIPIVAAVNHFEQGVLDGRATGRTAARTAWKRAQEYWRGT
jgi:enoyl-CoA hydratase/carnithine racemase